MRTRCGRPAENLIPGTSNGVVLFDNEETEWRG